MKAAWVNLPQWAKLIVSVASVVAAGIGILAGADKVVGQCYVWDMTVAPRVEERIAPTENTLGWQVAYTRATAPDSIIRRVDSIYVVNQCYNELIRGKITPRQYDSMITEKLMIMRKYYP